MREKPIIFIVSGPSGSGKSTLVQQILQLPDTMLSVSCTTRQPRAAESPGKTYKFVTREQFQQMKQNGAFLESAQVFGKNWYGTPWENWFAAQKKGVDLVLEIDVQGAQEVQQGQLKETVVSIFVLPPTPDELERRIRARGMDSEDEIERRLNQARTEIKALPEYYDYAVVNDNVERAGKQIQGIVMKERNRSAEERRNERVGLGAVAAAEKRRRNIELNVQRILELF
jgi:guanylate kinase